MLDVPRLLESGISVVATNYRFVHQAQAAQIDPPVKWPLEDAARALQFVRSKATEWNLDKHRIGACGGSAGACSSLWLALHDNMAQPQSEDPVARESTRLFCAAVVGAQTTLDPLLVRVWMPNATYGGHAFGFRSKDKDKAADFQRFFEGRDRVQSFIEEYSPLSHASADDPPMWLSYSDELPMKKGDSPNDPTHSVLYGRMLEEKLKPLGVDIIVTSKAEPAGNFKDSTDYFISRLTSSSARSEPKTSVSVADWPLFRGPHSTGLPDPGATPPHEWSAEKNIAWSADVVGLGWSSPIVTDGRIFITTVTRVAGDEPAQMGLYLGKNRGEGEHRYLVLCYDYATGKKLWERETHRGQPQRIHLKNSYASATAVTDGRRVVALFHDVGLFAFDLDGQPLWNVRLPQTRTRNDWGHGGSPTLHDGRIYLVSDNEDDSFVACYDVATGSERWRVARTRETNYATPFVWDSGTGKQLVVAATQRTVAYDLDGKERWSFTGLMSQLTVGTPFAAHGLLFVGSGYFQDQKRGLFAIKPGATGDITPRDGETSNAGIAWWHPKSAPYNPSTLVHGDELYILYDQAMLSCYDARTGAAHYEKRRIPEARGGFTASPWAHDGEIFSLSEQAETFVFKAGKEFELLRRNPLPPEPTLATPALVGDSLILRTASKLYRISKP